MPMRMVVVFMLTSAVLQAAAEGMEIHAQNMARALMIKDPSAMLTKLEDMVHHGEAPSFDLVATIKSTIQDEIMPTIQTTRDAAKQSTTDALNAIQMCNNESATKEKDIEALTEVSVNNSRSIHAACRDAQKIMHYHNSSAPDAYCVKLDKFLDDATPVHIPGGSSRADSVAYVKYACDTSMCRRVQITELADNCTAAEVRLNDKTVDCLAKQKAFEEAFCTWKTELELNCEVLDTCHSNAETVYDGHVAKTQTLEAKWDVETAALQQILCYCDVWLSADDERDNRSRHNATQFEVCRGQTYVPASMDYGTPAAKGACLLTSVASYPGTSGFITQEYSSFDDFFETVTPCTPTNAAPTTTQPSGLNGNASHGIVGFAVRYTLGMNGMVDGCPVGYSGISGEAACESAAAYLGYRKRDGTIRHDNAYPGCYFYEPTKTAYFNTHPNPDGTWHSSNAGQICELEATNAAPTTAAPTTTQAAGLSGSASAGIAGTAVSEQHRASYTFGEKGKKDGCPAGYSGISEEADCEHAAADLEYTKRPGITSNAAAYPGCYFYGPAKKAYFNTHLTPDGTWQSSNAGQICKLEGH